MISLEVHIGLTNWPDHMFMMKLNNPLVDLNSCFSLLMELGISSMKTALDCSKTWYQEIWNFLDMLKIKKLTGTGTDNKSWQRLEKGDQKSRVAVDEINTCKRLDDEKLIKLDEQILWELHQSRWLDYRY